MTNEIEHAPAPWTVAECGPAVRFQVMDAEGNPVASTYGQPTQAADVHLFAAAPLLLAALRAIVTPTGFDNLTLGEGGTHAKAIAAMLAAEGPGAAIDRHARALGFAPYHNGGGCMALGRDFGPSHSVLVTGDDGAHMPGQFPADPGWIVGFYDGEGNGAEETGKNLWEGTGLETFKAALAEAIDKAETADMEQSAQRRGDLPR